MEVMGPSASFQGSLKRELSIYSPDNLFKQFLDDVQNLHNESKNLSSQMLNSKIQKIEENYSFKLEEAEKLIRENKREDSNEILIIINDLLELERKEDIYILKERSEAARKIADKGDSIIVDPLQHSLGKKATLKIPIRTNTRISSKKDSVSSANGNSQKPRTGSPNTSTVIQGESFTSKIDPLETKPIDNSPSSCSSYNDGASSPNIPAQYIYIYIYNIYIVSKLGLWDD